MSPASRRVGRSPDGPPRVRHPRIEGLALAALAVLLVAVACGPGGGPTPPQPEPFTYLIDTAIEPRQPTLLGPGGERPIVALRDADGIQYDYPANEVIVLPQSQAQLDAFLARRGGQVVADHQEAGAERTVVVRLDAATFPLDALERDGRLAGVPGEHRFSSELAARLVALVLRERALGLRVATDGLHHPGQAVLLTSPERGGTDMFADSAFDSPLERPGVVAAWQYLAGQSLAGPLRRVRVAIIDGGFALTASGAAIPDGNGATDFPAMPLQHDYVTGAAIVSGVNAARCTGGTPCPWHGHGSASVATGALANGAYAAGTGGQVADAILLNVDLSTSQVKAAVDRARGLGAEVINMSFGGACGAFCQIEKDVSGYYLAFGRALAADIVMVAAAGNDGVNAYDDQVFPCALPMTMCIGALGSMDAARVFSRDNRAVGFSNHGVVVDLFAPTQIPAWYGTDASVPPGVATFGGTSASAPYVAGVVAMMRSVNPGLGVGDVFDILLDTAWTDSPDPKVPAYLNAFEAVRRASEYRLPADRFEPNDTPAAARTLATGVQQDLTIGRANDIDYFRLAAGGPRFLDLGLNYPGRLGRTSLPPIGREATQSCGSVEQVAHVRGPDTLGATYRISAGSFVWAVTSPGNPLPYHMHVNLRNATVAADAHEPNDTFGTARNLGDGGFVHGTLHAPGDVDFYRVYSQGAFSTMVLSMASSARVESSDTPLTLELFNAGQQSLASSTSSADCATQASVAIPQGFHVVRVSGGVGEYRLWIGSRATQHPLIDVSVIIYLILHPNVPVELGLREPELWFVYNHVSDDPATGLLLEAAGLNLTLFSEDGLQQLGESVASTDGQSHLLTLPATEAPFLVRVGRTEPRIAGAELPLIPARLTSLEP